MKRLLLLALLCLPLATPVRADDPPPPGPVAPSAIIAPKEVSGTGKKLDPFVFTRSTRCVLELTGPTENVAWDQEDAPTDTQILASRYASFSLYEDGLYQITAHGGAVYSKVWFLIKSGTDPPPGPNPPGPTPDPKPEPAPLWVVIVRDGASLSKLPQSQLTALNGAALRDYCKTHCRPGADGKTPDFRIYEPDTDVSHQSPAIQKAYKTAVEEMTKADPTRTTPWLTLSNGKTGYSGPLPTDEASILAKLKTYGGP